MENFQLQLFFQIIGIGSASGLLYHNDLLYLISDSSSFLYEYSINENELNKIALVENPEKNIPKKDKPDFESITLDGNKLLIFGSGSTENRDSLKTYHFSTKKIRAKDLSELYNKIKSQFSIQNDELNIEGVFYLNKKFYLFQRGNGKNASNGIFIVNKDKEIEIQFKKVELPKINNIQSSFTDAILVDETIYFLASVEDTISTYDDGEILGTFLGKMKLADFSIEETILISDKNKFEGITLYKKTENQLEFLLCEDNDTDVLESKIYKLTINK
ncbi:hypothetical protein FLGE108171_09075 [Flavobacterium gelidilacus]|uniref:DUF6929 family protein n=1 Tax=Flavobacterium gelidilacus TaxID=206041 RepID=UPI00040AC2F5|nr:hypothetical protein [Flavobacterium gelidilacus]